MEEEFQQKLIEKKVILVPHGSFVEYVGAENVLRLKVPVFGNREVLEWEADKRKSFGWFVKAGVRLPQEFRKPEDIDRLCIVKSQEAERGYERAFFFADSFEEYKRKARERVDEKKIRAEGLEKAVIEEYVIGAQVNFNFFYSAIDDEIELMGTDTRRQTNIDGLIRLSADEQTEVLKHERPSYIENGIIACTVKESLLEKGLDAAERLVKTLRREAPPGIIGPFALQGAITPGPPREEFVVFDVSMRIPGSPGTMFTPYTNYLYGRNISTGERIAM
jgi:5-formaminoimidazole-4-carboxamide-1-(beta)-D-ribofuranosyl 5'-monophosphate synthetase